MKKQIKRYFPLFLVVAAVVSGVGTYSTLTHDMMPFSANKANVFGWVLASFITVLGLFLVIAFKIVELWVGRRKQSVGSRLQLRIIRRFGLVTVIPTIILAIFSSLYFHFGIHAWFNDQVGTALNESVQVAESYLVEHKKIIAGEALAMANDLNKQAKLVERPKRFSQIVNTQAALRSLTEAVVFQRDKIIARAGLSFSLALDVKKISENALQKAATGEVVILTGETDDRVLALVKLNNFFDTYLLVGKLVDSKVLQHVELTKGSATEYQQLRQNISQIQFTFSGLFGAVSLLLLLASMWFGVVVSGEMVKPIALLVKATESVKGGDMTSRVKEGPENDELGTLNRAFNRMTGQLERQHGDLTLANRQIDERRRFIEAVLSGVSAGVIALDGSRNITLVNRSAGTLLGIDTKDIINKDFTKLYPDINPLLDEAENSENRSAQGDITMHVNQRDSSFHVKIVAEEFSDEIEGYIVTFDDITELQSAQRTAAWADVARRVAHEIKNPLTPIQLASERLKNKYIDEVQNDKETFERYIDTIIRHVGDIRNIVEEFVGFARMPAPIFASHDVAEIIRDTVFSREVAQTGIEYNQSFGDQQVMLNCDRGQITQIFTNLLKNAEEVIDGTGTKNGKIGISLEEGQKKITIVIEDNGAGFPEELLDKITEPYVTTREKGTGLGLAIVKKIVDDHQGKLKISNIKDGKKILGARVTLTFQKAN